MGVQMAKIRQMSIEVDDHGIVIWEGKEIVTVILERVLQMRKEILSEGLLSIIENSYQDGQLWVSAISSWSIFSLKYATTVQWRAFSCLNYVFKITVRW